MEKKFKNHAVVGMCALGLIGLNSCLKVDETYDLDKDFDMTITVGGDLTVPGSSTEKFKLGDLLDLEDNEVIKVVDGSYHLQQNGESRTNNVEVPGVSIDDMNGKFEGVEFSQDVNGSGSSGEIIISYAKGIGINIEKNDVTSDIKDITGAVTTCYNTYLKFTKSGIPFEAVIDNNYTIEFPSYITVKSEDNNWIVKDGNKLVLNKAEGLEITDNTKVQFQLTYITFDGENAKFNYNDNGMDNSSIMLGGSVNLDGNITASVDNLTSGNISLAVDIFSDRMVLNSVTGKVDPEVKIEIDPININGLPDFLAEDDVVLDLTDPRIFITVTNSSPISVDMSAELKSYKNGSIAGEASLENVNIPAERNDYVICLNQKIEDGWNEAEQIMYVKVEGLSNLIKNIPDRIEIQNIETNVIQEEVTIDLNNTYPIITDYKVDTPLKFGPETNITYTETIDGWDADLEDMEFSKVEASMTATNAIPLGINLTGVAIDKNGKPLDGVTVDLNVDIDAGSIDNPTKENIKFTLTTDNGSIKGLDGIKLTVIAKASESSSEEELKEDQYMQFDDIKLGLKGGITMDLN